jgi:hypothetical protein
MQVYKNLDFSFFMALCHTYYDGSLKKTTYICPLLKVNKGYLLTLNIKDKMNQEKK